MAADKSRNSTYLINSSIIDYYYTQLIGDPTDLPVIKASSTFDAETNLGLIDGNPYGPKGLAWGATNTFFRQIANLVLDTTDVAVSKPARGIHWPSSQATSISNCVFLLADGPKSNQYVAPTSSTLEDVFEVVMMPSTSTSGFLGRRLKGQLLTASS